MGTNYYIRQYCQHCGETWVTKERHVGKQSAGWKFNFNSTEIKSYEDWVKFLREHEKYFTNEYGEKINVDDFLKGIEVNKNGHHELGEEVQNGCRFHDGDFS